MDESGRLRRARALFDAVIDLEPGVRRAQLGALAEGDAALQRDVLALVDESERTGGPGFASRLTEPGGEVRADAERLVGQRLGAYDIVRLIGLGGMGVVYEGARADDQYRKRVAIKLVQGDLHSRPVLARFRRERQILASLQHRNIATLLDGGVSPDGRPFLVMEHVAGEPITAWCDRRSLGVEKRLALFRQVCEAVRHAHRNLVIHRDIKPGNILVTADGDVKLLDFGVAKILGADPDDDGMPLTRGGVRVFTPEYASPEQVRGETLTTASDIYSLGVVLYELLAGRRPHETAVSTAMTERAVLESPIAPPSAVATEEAAAARDAVALRRQLAGEVDSIVMLALRPEPELRWRSVDAFSDDIKRHLERQPVEALRDWRGYQLRKFIERHRAAASATALVVVALVAGAIATGIEARQARTAQARAERVSDFLTGLLQSVRPTTGGRDVPVSELLDAAAKRVGTEMAGEPGVQAELETVIGQSDLALGRLDEAERHLRAALAIQVRLTGARSVEVALALSNLGGVYMARGDLEPADSIVRLSLGIARSIRSDRDTLVAALLDQLGSVAHDQGNFALAESTHREALEIRTRVFGPNSDRTALTMTNVAVALGEQGRWAAAESLHRRALAVFVRNHPEPSTQVADGENALATALDLQGKYDEAGRLYADVLARREKLLGRQHPDYAFTAMNYSMFLFDRGHFDEAASLTRQVLALRGRSLPESHPAIAASLQTLGRCLDRLGRHDEAQHALEESLALRRRYVGPDSWLVASSRGVLGEHFTLTRDFPRAERLLLDVDASLSRELGPSNPRTLTNVRRIVALYGAMGRPDRADLFRARIPAGTP